MDWLKTYRRQRRQAVSRAQGTSWSEQRFHRDLWRELIAQAQAAGMLNRLAVALIAEIALWELGARRFEDRLHAQGALKSLSAEDLESFKSLAALRDRCRALMREFYALCGLAIPLPAAHDPAKGAGEAEAGAPAIGSVAQDPAKDAPEADGGPLAPLPATPPAQSPANNLPEAEAGAPEAPNGRPEANSGALAPLPATPPAQSPANNLPEAEAGAPAPRSSEDGSTNSGTTPHPETRERANVQSGPQAEELTPEEVAARVEAYLKKQPDARLDAVHARIRAMRQANTRDYRAALERHLRARRPGTA